MKRPKLDPADQAAKLAKRTFAAEDRAKAMREAQKEALAVRENMTRLRELRLAKESREAQSKQDTVVTSKPKRRVRIIRVAP
jgi:hypothetical protein